MALTPTCLWPVTASLVLALDDRLGPPVDSYVNGTQTWLTDDGPETSTLEWRLHPVAAYEPPGGLSHYDVWEQVAHLLATGSNPGDLALGAEPRSLDSLWDGLECFPAYGDESEPASLATRATERIGLAPDSVGIVDHDRIGEMWERAHGRRSIVAMLREELGGPQP